MECSNCGTRGSDPFSYCYDCHIFTKKSGARRKKAVVCGISYKSTARGPVKELKGCVEDAKSMKDLLINKFEFPESNIRLLTDEEGTDPDLLPTKKNMISAMKWLVEDCQAGDSLVFTFAGHGAQKRDTDGDEIDGYDETLVPLDFSRFGDIVDDEINRIMVNPLPTDVKLHAIIDACHSGTVLDLEWLCKLDSSGEYDWEDHRPLSGANKGTKGGEVFAISGCDDDQEAGNAPVSGSSSAGAMTSAFMRAVKLHEADTYADLFRNMQNVMKDYSDLRKAEMPTGNNKPLIQDPQLTSNQKLYPHKTFLPMTVRSTAFRIFYIIYKRQTRGLMILVRRTIVVFDELL